MTAAGAVRADGLVGDVAGAAFDAIIDGEMADRTERFVVKGGNAESGAELLVESAQVLEMRGEGGNLQTVVGKKEFLITGIPEARELALEHDGGRDGHLIKAVRALAELGAAAIFFHTNDAAGAAYGKAESGEAFDGLGLEAFFDIPHGVNRLKKEAESVKGRSQLWSRLGRIKVEER